MKVLFLTKDFDHYSSKYRVIQYLDEFRRRGVECALRRFPESLAQWGKIVAEARSHDILFLQKRKLNGVEMAALKGIGGVKIVYDIDDAVMFSMSRPDSAKPMARFEKMARRCDMVTVGNSFLLEIASRFTPNARLIPNGVDLAAMRCKSHTPDARGPVIVGWNGGPKSLKYLQPLLPVLRRVRADGHDVRLKIVSQEFLEDAEVPIIRQAWDEARYAEEVGSFDIAVSPLDESPQAKGKCAAKLLHYMACDVPTVASPVGAHLDIVRHGENGYLASTEAEWKDKLMLLIDDPGCRARIGLAGRRTIEERYALPHIASRLVDIFHEIAD